MKDEEEDCSDVPEGVAIFPLIPEELGIQPLLLAVLHAIVFIDGSTEDVIVPEAAEETLHYLITYLTRIQGTTLQRIREDMTCLLDYAKQAQWSAEQQAFLRSFFTDFCVGGEPNE